MAGAGWSLKNCATRAAVLLLAPQDLEEVGHVHRVVAGAGHDLRADDVGLRLGVAAVLQEDRVQPEPADDVDDLRGRAARWPRAEDPAEHAEARLRRVGLGRVVGAVAQRDVRDLVGDDAGELAFGAGRSMSPRFT